MVKPFQGLIKASDMGAHMFSGIPGASARFVRGDDRGLAVNLAISTYPPGASAPEHRHPEGQVFVVWQGRGVYSVDGVEVLAEPGDVVVVPPNALHGFRVDGDVALRHVGLLDGAHTLFQ
jgi:quercetin dioxygenase-like cupin family protein